MSMPMFLEIYTNLYKQILDHSKNLDLFISKNENLSDFYKSTTKSLFDYSNLHQESANLPQLLIDDFDLEQIWQQIYLNVKNVDSLQREVLLPFTSDTYKRLRDSTDDVRSKKKVRFSDVQYDDDDDDGLSDDNDDDNDKRNNIVVPINDADASELEKLDDILEVEESIFKNVSDSDSEDDKHLKKVLTEYRQKLEQEKEILSKNDDVYNDDDIDDSKDDGSDKYDYELDKSSDDDINDDYGDPLVRLKEAIEQSKAKQIGSKNVLKVEDRFLNLKQMEDFVKEAETKCDQLSDDDLSVDDMSEEEGNVKYEDFFDDEKVDAKTNKKSLLDSEESDCKENGERELIRDPVDNLSTLEKRSLSMQKKISELENESLSAKPWQMKGEITAKGRPENSLLSEVLEFDTTTKPAPLITEEVTKSIEDRIIERLKSNVWDGPKRKVKVKESEFTLKKKVVLDQEKSKLSLEQIYENEYLQQNETDDKEPEEFDVIRKSMTSLFMKLDALSNFHYAPKPAIPDLRIISNVPSISVEEAIPVAVSNAMLLAPQEILEKRKGELAGSTELSRTDKLRARRSKKRRQHFKRLDKDRSDKMKMIKSDKNNILKNLKEDLNINELTERKRNSKLKRKNKKTK